MKSNLFATALLSFSLMLNSFCYADSKPSIYSSKEIAITAPFQRIAVGQNIEIVLVQDSSKSFITVTGEDKIIEDVYVNMSNNQLTVKAKKPALNKQIIVYVPVRNISLIELADGASVIGKGDLQFKNLVVIVNYNCFVNLKAIGSITVTPVEDGNFVFLRNEAYKVLYK